MRPPNLCCKVGQSGLAWQIKLVNRAGVMRLLPPHHPGPLRTTKDQHLTAEEEPTLSFLGQYEHNLDAKDRLTVPSRFRAALADGVVLAKGLDPSVWVFAPGGYENFTKTFLGETNPLGKRGRMLRRHFHGGAFDDSLDSAGRIRLPKKLIEHADLGEGPCVIVGSDDWFEIWNAERWAAYEKDMDAEVSDVAEKLSEDEQGG